MTVDTQGCPPLSTLLSIPCSRTHACSPFPVAPSSQGHTRGTGVLWSLAGSDTDQSEGGTRSPRQLVHRHKGGNPGIAQNRSVLPVTHLIVKPCLAFSIIALETWVISGSSGPAKAPPSPSVHRPGLSLGTLPPQAWFLSASPPHPRAHSPPYQTAVTTLTSHACLAQAAPTPGITGFCPAWGTITPCRKWGLWLLPCPPVQSFQN